MDTKSKDSKKNSFFIAGGLVALAVAIFLALYPAFERQAAGYYTEPLRSDQLLEYFYFSNLVLYKNMLEKTQPERVKFSDLCLRMEEEEVSEDEMYRDSREYIDEQTVTELKSVLADGMDRAMGNWKDIIANTLARRVDYCVIDHKSGEILKNTGRSIESFYEDKNARKEDEPYVYYVMMAFDGSGNLADISVRDEKPDELLKNVQSVMDGKWLGEYYGRFLQYPLPEQDAVYFEAEGKKLTWSIDDRPRDMTFIYACTQEQKENILSMWRNDSFMEAYQYEVKQAYLEAGVAYAYWCILAALAAAAILLSRTKRYCLHRLPGAGMYMEISLTAIACLFGVVSYIAVEMVYVTNNVSLAKLFSEYLEFLPPAVYSVLIGSVNVMALMLIFGSWYYFVTSLCGVFDMGLKEFVLSRSMIVRLFRGLAHWVKSWKDRLEGEILHADLGEGAERIIRKLVLINSIFLAAACFMWIFGWAVLIVYSAVLYIAMKKYVQRLQGQYRKLLAATRSVADGNLQTKFEDDWGVFESYKQELAKIQDGFKTAVDKEVKSQRMKTELITNVSHDLKTPLTAITTYIELLGEDGISKEQRNEYLGVLARKSERLKFLIEDLFEVSKASSGNITLNPVDVDICNLMRQVYLEYEDRVEEADLIFRFRMPEEKVILHLDSQKTYRVFENLYVNIIKYAMPHTRVYVNAKKTGEGIEIELKNMSAAELNVPPEDLTERFVRGDSSRNTEGSGLGLAIARSFVELQGGKMKVDIDGDLFKVTINW